MIIKHNGKILDIEKKPYNCFMDLFSVHDITDESKILFLGKYIASDLKTVLTEIEKGDRK